MLINYCVHCKLLSLLFSLLIIFSSITFIGCEFSDTDGSLDSLFDSLFPSDDNDDSSGNNSSQNTPALGTESNPYTISNCSDLVTLVNLVNPSDSFISTFANRYDGDYIKFDGCVWAKSLSSGYNTRYDVLLGTKDFDADNAYGPNFQIRQHYFGSTTINVGHNVTVLARVGSYNTNSEIFILEYATITRR